MCIICLELDKLDLSWPDAVGYLAESLDKVDKDHAKSMAMELAMQYWEELGQHEEDRYYLKRAEHLFDLLGELSESE